MTTETPSRPKLEADDFYFVSNFLDWAKSAEDFAVPPEVIAKLAECTAPDERVAIAKNDIMPKCEPLAHVVIGYSLSDPAEKIPHFERVLGTTRDAARNHSEFPAEWFFELATLGLATTLWKQNKRAEAISVLEEASVDSLETSQLMIDSIRFTLTTYLICEGNFERARVVLDGESVDTAEWHYLNGLLQFRARGDDYVSRGASDLGFHSDTDDIASLLVGTEYDTEEFSPESLLYAKVTREAWEAIPGALDWFIRIERQPNPHRENPDEEIDVRREKRICDEMELVLSYVKRDDLKSAKRSLGAALREADRHNDGGYHFSRILKSCRLLCVDSSSDWVLERINSRFAWLERKRATAKPLFLAYTYKELAQAYINFGQMDKVQVCASRAYELLDQIRDSSDLVLEMNLLTLLGQSAMSRGDYANLEGYARKLVELSDTVCGSRHAAVVLQLQVLRHALHNLERHEEEREVATRVYSLDQFADNDEELEDLEYCDFEDLLPEDIRKRIWRFGGDPDLHSLTCDHCGGELHDHVEHVDVEDAGPHLLTDPNRNPNSNL